MTRSAVAHRVRRGSWQRLGTGLVLTAPDPPSRRDWWAAAMLLTGPGGALSGWDALGRYGIRAPEPAPPQVLALDTSGRHRGVGPLRIRPTARTYRTAEIAGDFSGQPVLTLAAPARAIADYALVATSDRTVLAVVGSAVQRGVVTVAQLRTELDDGPRNGSGRLRRVLRDAGTVPARRPRPMP